VTACGVRQSSRLEWRIRQLGHISNRLRWEISDRDGATLPMSTKPVCADVFVPTLSADRAIELATASMALDTASASSARAWLSWGLVGPCSLRRQPPFEVHYETRQRHLTRGFHSQGPSQGRQHLATSGSSSAPCRPNETPTPSAACLSSCSLSQYLSSYPWGELWKKKEARHRCSSRSVSRNQYTSPPPESAVLPRLLTFLCLKTAAIDRMR
jgi:hypothetical protein